jgi:hypothetical protein
VAITIFLIATAPQQCATATAASPDAAFVIAQTSMGAPDPLPSMSPTLPTPAPYQPPAPSSPKFDYLPPSLAPAPAPGQPSTSTDVMWGAISFTADGSYSTVWKMASQAEAEARVAKKCAEYGHGGCQTVSFSGQECVALAIFNGPYRRRRWYLSFTAGGDTYPDAQNAALARCNSDERSQGRCQPRTAACADGR